MVRSRLYLQCKLTVHLHRKSVNCRVGLGCASTMCCTAPLVRSGGFGKPSTTDKGGGCRSDRRGSWRDGRVQNVEAHPCVWLESRWWSGGGMDGQSETQTV